MCAARRAAGGREQLGRSEGEGRRRADQSLHGAGELAP